MREFVHKHPNYRPQKNANYKFRYYLTNNVYTLGGGGRIIIISHRLKIFSFFIRLYGGGGTNTVLKYLKTISGLDDVQRSPDEMVARISRHCNLESYVILCDTTHSLICQCQAAFPSSLSITNKTGEDFVKKKKGTKE